MGKKRVWVIDDPTPAFETESEFVPGWDRGPFVVRGRTRLLFALGVLLGPLAVAFTRRGVGRWLWTLVAVASVALWAATLWRWPDLERWIERGRIPVVWWAVAMLLASVLGILAWARALHGIGTSRRFDPEKLPAWLRHPVVAAILGIVAPGWSFLTNGGAWRAAFAVFTAGIAGLAALLLWKARWLWQANAATTYWSVPSSALETTFLAAACVGGLAGLGWLVAILEGVRCGLDDKRAGRALRGDVLTFVLLATLVVVYAASEPSMLAKDANEIAIALERDGMRRAPLLLARVAQHFDPADPAYAVHVADLLEACGDPDGARGARAALQVRWREYQRLFAPVHADSAATPPGVSLSTAAVAGDSVATPGTPLPLVTGAAAPDPDS